MVKVRRRLVQAAAERRFEIRWVKVKGHSGDEGNNAADKAAGWAQNGGTKGENDIEGLMQSCGWTEGPTARADTRVLPRLATNLSWASPNRQADRILNLDGCPRDVEYAV